jgi:hypothetical protein
MKVIDLYNKMAKGEKVPRKFTYKGYLWEYDVKNKMWFYYFGESKSHRFDRLFYMNMILNDEVEILEEEKKITPTDFENLGYALGSIQKYINKGYDKAIEEKKIPEKLDPLIGYDIQQFDDLKEYVEITTNDLFGKVNKVIDTLNRLSDYLKSKGDE